MKNDKGHSSITVLVLILFISILFLGTSNILRQSLIRSRNFRMELEDKISRKERAERVFLALREDPTPESQSLSDPVWQTIEEIISDDIEAELVDISSRLNPNWLRPKIFEVTQLKEILQSGYSAEQIEEFRSETGITTDLEAFWLDFFGEENLALYFSLYNWANINTTHEASLERLYIERYEENGSSAFRSRIQQGLVSFKLWEKQELPNLLGSASEHLYPVINTLPQFNVHFTDPLILESLLTYPYRNEPLAHSIEAKEQILNLREEREITPEELVQILQPNDKQKRILEYLGTQTWFWKYSEIEGDLEYFWIFAWDGIQWYQIEMGESLLESEDL